MYFINDGKDLAAHVRVHNGFALLRHSAAYRNRRQVSVLFALLTVTVSSVYEIEIVLMAAP